MDKMQDGKMMMINGETMPMEMDMTMSDGTKVMLDGTVIRADDTTWMIMEDEYITITGKMSKKNAR